MGKTPGKSRQARADDLVLMADVHDAAGNRAADSRGHGNGGVDVGLGKAREAYSGVLADWRYVGRWCGRCGCGSRYRDAFKAPLGQWRDALGWHDAPLR